MFSSEAVKMESTWNKSVKVMFDLPYATHRWLIEPVSGSTHLRRFLINRFLNFVKQINKSSKFVTNLCLSTIQYDVRSITGYNLRKIMIETGKTDINQHNDVRTDDIEYHPVRNEDKWKISVIKECIDVKFGNLSIEGFSSEELEEICSHLCVS
jgi:hypothetical protein